MTSPRAGVRTGGVGFGNVNVEAIQVPGRTDSRPRLLGFAFGLGARRKPDRVEETPAGVNVDERRVRLRAQLVNGGGGPLGVVDVKEVIIGAVDVEAVRRLWQKPLDPTLSGTSNKWQVGAGPGIRLVRASENRIEALVIRVASLDRAKAFLRDRPLLGAETAGHVTIDPSKVGGLELRLVGR